ncbi:MAG TPA: MBL fold metallo-hydrolase [Myxococcota bacterium]|nr:MBL fold metallo-hydrolase [Myxococcota bacterium]
MRELQWGLWHWTAPHPEWTPAERWPREVSSYAMDDGTRLVLFDPLSVPDELLELAGERSPIVVLTAPWHERDTESLVTRLGAVPVFVPPPDTPEDLVRKFGIPLEQAGRGSPDVAWLLASDRGPDRAHLYAAGDELPLGIEALRGREHNDLVLWIESRRAVLTGDTLVDFGKGLQVNDWLRGGVTRKEVVERLRPLLNRPVELVLPAHGEPTNLTALVRALA